MDTLTYWNGTWHEGNPAILGPRDHAFWLGSMVFDGGRAFEGCGPTSTSMRNVSCVRPAPSA